MFPSVVVGVLVDCVWCFGQLCFGVLVSCLLVFVGICIFLFMFVGFHPVLLVVDGCLLGVCYSCYCFYWLFVGVWCVGRCAFLNLVSFFVFC